MTLVKYCQDGVEPVPVGDRCTGCCCREFTLPFDHVQIAHWWNGASILNNLEDIEMIVSMARPLPSVGSNYYTCVLFDGTNCTAYEARPRMCKAYPYDQPCRHGLLCASKDARSGKIGDKYHLPVLVESGQLNG